MSAFPAWRANFAQLVLLGGISGVISTPSFERGGAVVNFHYVRNRHPFSTSDRLGAKGFDWLADETFQLLKPLAIPPLVFGLYDNMNININKIWCCWDEMTAATKQQLPHLHAHAGIPRTSPRRRTTHPHTKTSPGHITGRISQKRKLHSAIPHSKSFRYLSLALSRYVNKSTRNTIQ